jgi:hypothetical protein
MRSGDYTSVHRGSRINASSSAASFERLRDRWSLDERVFVTRS